MPVRIYEIAKNLGVQSKDVLAKAKDLKITNAKVASSSLDKITAEYLEEQLAKDPNRRNPKLPPKPRPPLRPPQLRKIHGPRAHRSRRTGTPRNRGHGRGN